MKDSLKRFLDTAFPWPADKPKNSDTLANTLLAHIRTPEFTALYARECLSNPDLGAREIFQQWRTTMSAFTDAMTALGQQIAAATAANSTDNTAHLATIDAHLIKLDTEEGADEATEADTTAGLQALLAGANGTPAATTVPTPAPTAAPGA